ncbi:hypothetical protein EDB81DRAFT_277019 [Dactylonectria macrodidyma]|uniref:Secreted protein n=1 Tax=Dactylonectria macrodidyma TaxID=307937 RepID=A0A9P9FP71_9HYPO|nr:hypothetical protein EDB81DRAFT_277019 [Dactylonectria macrodidyma]
MVGLCALDLLFSVGVLESSRRARKSRKGCDACGACDEESLVSCGTSRVGEGLTTSFGSVGCVGAPPFANRDVVSCLSDLLRKLATCFFAPSFLPSSVAISQQERINHPVIPLSLPSVLGTQCMMRSIDVSLHQVHSCFPSSHSLLPIHSLLSLLPTHSLSTRWRC